MTRDVFPERLTMLMEMTGTTQQELAEHIDRTRETVSNWQRGKRSPNHEYLRRVADYFGVSVAWLLGQDDQTPQGVLDVIRFHDPALAREYRHASPEAQRDIQGYIRMRLNEEARQRRSEDK